MQVELLHFFNPILIDSFKILCTVDQYLRHQMGQSFKYVSGKYFTRSFDTEYILYTENYNT